MFRFLPRELLCQVEARLDFDSFCNLCCALEQQNHSSRPFTVSRLKRLSKQCKTLSCREEIVEIVTQRGVQDKYLEMTLLNEFELTLAFTRGIECIHDSGVPAISESVNIFNNVLPGILFVSWHRAAFDNWDIHSRVKHVSCSKVTDCGRCIAAAKLVPSVYSYSWQSGGWPVIRESEDNTGLFIDTIQSPILSASDFLNYDDEGEAGSYKVLWPYGADIVNPKILRMPIYLASSVRDRVDHNSFAQAAAAL